MGSPHSTHHSKITGDFAEHLILYWLSKYGFECARVDHTGIDLIARNPHPPQEVMGISVKGRSRKLGRETAYLGIPNDEIDKVQAACEAFGCIPYFALVVDAGNKIQVFILPMDELLQLFPPGGRAIGWKMLPKYLMEYRQNPKIISFEFTYEIHRWFTSTPVLAIDEYSEEQE